MLKKKEEVKKPGGEFSNNGQLGEVVAALQRVAEQQQEFGERLDELDRKSSAAGEAQLLVAKRVFDTDRKHLPEMTVISLRMVNPFSLADACASILDDDVQEGRVTLGQIRRESIYRHLRSVKGNLLQKGSELAMQQEAQKAEEGPGWDVKE